MLNYKCRECMHCPSVTECRWRRICYWYWYC